MSNLDRLDKMESDIESLGQVVGELITRLEAISVALAQIDNAIGYSNARKEP